MKMELRLSVLALFFVVVMTACGSGGDDTIVATGPHPAFITVDPSGKFAYVANWGANNIAVYTIDTTTGALTAGTTVAAATKPVSITVDPSGKFAYAANWGSNSISVYSINATTGALTAGTAVAAGTIPLPSQLTRQGSSPMRQMRVITRSLFMPSIRPPGR